jgi:GntR family transcriptional regulator
MDQKDGHTRGRPTPGGESRQTYPHRAHSLLRSSIRTADLGLGELLDEGVLVRGMKTSRNAIREALHLLADEGLVARQRGRGTRIVAGILSAPLDHAWGTSSGWGSGAPGVETTEIERRPAPFSGNFLTRRLGIDDVELLLVEHLVKLDGLPIALRSTYLPLDPDPTPLLDRLDELPEVYGECFGIALGEHESTVEAVASDARTSKLLQIAEGAPTLVVEVVVKDVAGTPRLLVFTHHRGDRVALSA